MAIGQDGNGAIAGLGSMNKHAVSNRASVFSGASRQGMIGVNLASSSSAGRLQNRA